jgi:hypothetical protein
MLTNKAFPDFFVVKFSKFICCTVLYFYKFYGIIKVNTKDKDVRR